MSTIIDPRLPTGFRDSGPSETMARQAMLDIIRRVFELNGFDPLDLSAVERAEVVGAEVAGSKQIYCAAHPDQLVGTGVTELDPNQRALRFDLTVGLCRYVAAVWDSGEIPRPFKRWQLGLVWRGERAQKGRYREFYQCDIDTVGSASMQADAEIVIVMAQVMQALNVGSFTIRINNRKLLNGLPQLAGFDPQLITDVLVILDKQDKIGTDGVRKALAKDAGLQSEQIQRITDFQALPTTSVDEFLVAAQTLFAGNDTALLGLTELREIVDILHANQLPAEQWTIDPSIARGLGYYTGPVFETVLNDLPQIGSVLSGGRYDGLVGKFRKAGDLPAVGASIGLSRLLTALQELGRLPNQKTVTVATILPRGPEFRTTAMGVLRVLHQAGVNAQLYMGEKTGTGKQLQEIASNGVPFAVLVGDDMATVSVRDLRARTNTDLPLAELANWLQTR